MPDAKMRSSGDIVSKLLSYRTIRAEARAPNQRRQNKRNKVAPKEGTHEGIG
jgi:hypothetical protein